MSNQLDWVLDERERDAQKRRRKQRDTDANRGPSSDSGCSPAPHMVRQGGRSGAIVAQDGRGIVASQLETLEKASRLRVQVLGPDPVTSLLDGYSQSSIDNYFLILKVLSRSCPRSAEAACDLILPRINGGLLSLLQLSVVCGLFSMEIAEVAIARLRGRDRDELEVPGAIERFNEYLGVIDEIKAETDRWMRLAAM